MIKLIASDIDGTLLRGGAAALSEEVFTCIRALHRQGILFCAASGRQYTSLRKLFAPVADEIIYLCENGAIVYQDGAVLAKTPIAQSDAAQLIAQITAEPGCEVLISGADTSYAIPRRDGFADTLRTSTGNNVRVVGSRAEIPEEIIKVSAWCEKGAALYEPVFAPVWSRHLNVAIAGRQWLDFTLANKGTALAQICDTLGFSHTQTMVFGDNFNDVPMFRFAGKAYAMASAAPAVRAAAHATCDSVEEILRTQILL